MLHSKVIKILWTSYFYILAVWKQVDITKKWNKGDTQLNRWREWSKLSWYRWIFLIIYQNCKPLLSLPQQTVWTCVQVSWARVRIKNVLNLNFMLWGHFWNGLLDYPQIWTGSLYCLHYKHKSSWSKVNFLI